MKSQGGWANGEWGGEDKGTLENGINQNIYVSGKLVGLWDVVDWVWLTKCHPHKLWLSRDSKEAMTTTGLGLLLLLRNNKKLTSLTKFSNQFTFRCSGKISQHFRGIYRHRKSIFFQISKRETRTMSTCNWLLDLETLGSQGEVAHVQNHWFWNGVWQAKVKWHRSWYVYFRSWVSRLDPRLFVQTDHFQSLIQDDVFARLLIKPSFLIGDGNVWFKPKK